MRDVHALPPALPHTSACLRPQCGQVVYARGLCFCCYRQANVLVYRKRTTWARLEVNGKVLPRRDPHAPHRKPTHEGNIAHWLLEVT